MFSTIFGGVVGAVVDKLIAPFTDLFKSYLNKEISVEELRARMVASLLSSFAQVEVSHADAITKTYDSFMKAATQSLMMRCVWASVAISQLCVLIWHQVGISTLCYFVGNPACWPSSGKTVEWAYALLGFCIGAGPLILRAGPGSAAFDQWKSLIKK